jgi:hypothetical protein
LWEHPAPSTKVAGKQAKEIERRTSFIDGRASLAGGLAKEIDWRAMLARNLAKVVDDRARVVA